MITKRQIKQIGYYCKDYKDIENFSKAMNDDISYDCHHRLETHTSDGILREVFLSMEELIALGMYWNRPAEELILLPRNEHQHLHKSGKVYISEEGRKALAKKVSLRVKGENNPMFGKKHSEETKKLMSEHRPDQRGEKNPAFGRHWFNNGTNQVFTYDCPEGYIKGKLKKEARGEE